MTEELKKSIGPGLIMAAAAIGVSHLVQSTRAGADFGFALVWAVVLANLFKYPFLEFGPRYAIATGNHMIHGYAKLGRIPLWIFIVFTVGSMFAVLAAVTIVTASLAAELTGITLSPQLWSGIVLALCVSLLIRGSYAILDGIIKFFMVLLAVSTVIAVVAALFQTGVAAESASASPELWSAAGFAFLIALMGWMPIPVDASVWHSIWTLEREKQTRYKPTLKESLLDFNIGYIGAAVIALLFLSLGALILHGSGTDFAASGGAFSKQLISLYTLTLGDWSYAIIVICAFSTMFSTTFAVADTYPRVCAILIETVRPNRRFSTTQWYRILLISISTVAFLILVYAGDHFRLLIDFATSLSFLMAPVLAYLNIRLILGRDIPDKFRPKPWLRILAYSGLLFLTGFALATVFWLLFL
ncbi:MAG: Nramp family divalent metal transporter [Balneolaceae bacterium]